MLPSVMNKQKRDEAAPQPQRPQLPGISQQMQANTTSRMTPPSGQRPVFSSMSPDNGQWGGRPRYMTPQSGAYQNTPANANVLPRLQENQRPFMYPGAQNFNDQARMQWERQQRALGNLGWNTNAPYQATQNTTPMPQQPPQLSQGQQQAAAQHFGIKPVYAQPDMSKPISAANNDMVAYQQRLQQQQQYYNSLKPMFSQWPPPDQYITPIQP